MWLAVVGLLILMADQVLISSHKNPMHFHYGNSHNFQMTSMTVYGSHDHLSHLSYNRWPQSCQFSSLRLLIGVYLN